MNMKFRVIDMFGVCLMSKVACALPFGALLFFPELPVKRISSLNNKANIAESKS